MNGTGAKPLCVGPVEHRYSHGWTSPTCQQHICERLWAIPYGSLSVTIEFKINVSANNSVWMFYNKGRTIWRSLQWPNQSFALLQSTVQPLFHTRPVFQSNAIVMAILAPHFVNLLRTTVSSTRWKPFRYKPSSCIYLPKFKLECFITEALPYGKANIDLVNFLYQYH